MKRTTSTSTLGRLISVLYDEIAKVTPDRKTQTKLVYLTLLDMQKRRLPKAL